MIVCSAFWRRAGQRQRIADVIGDILDLGALVVVGEDDRPTFAGQAAYLLRPCGLYSSADMAPSFCSAGHSGVPSVSGNSQGLYHGAVGSHTEKQRSHVASDS